MRAKSQKDEKDENEADESQQEMTGGMTDKSIAIFVEDLQAYIEEIEEWVERETNPLLLLDLIDVYIKDESNRFNLVDKINEKVDDEMEPARMEGL